MSSPLNPSSPGPQAVQQAMLNLEMLNALDACPGWHWFVAQIEAKIEALEKSVLEDDTLSEAVREKTRQERRTLKREILERLANARQGAERTIKNAAGPVLQEAGGGSLPPP